MNTLCKILNLPFCRGSHSSWYSYKNLGWVGLLARLLRTFSKFIIYYCVVSTYLSMIKKILYLRRFRDIEDTEERFHLIHSNFRVCRFSSYSIYQSVNGKILSFKSQTLNFSFIIDCNIPQYQTSVHLLWHWLIS